MNNDLPLALLENTAYNNIENVSTAALHHDVDYASDLNPNEPIYSDRNKRATCPYPTTTEERSQCESALNTVADPSSEDYKASSDHEEIPESCSPLGNLNPNVPEFVPTCVQGTDSKCFNFHILNDNDSDFEGNAHISLLSIIFPVYFTFIEMVY